MTWDDGEGASSGTQERGGECQCRLLSVHEKTSKIAVAPRLDRDLLLRVPKPPAAYCLPPAGACSSWKVPTGAAVAARLAEPEQAASAVSVPTGVQLGTRKEMLFPGRYHCRCLLTVVPDQVYRA